MLSGRHYLDHGLYFKYRRGIAIRLGFVVTLCMLVSGYLSFFLGKEGITITSGIIALVFGFCIVAPLLMFMFKGIISPLQISSGTLASSQQMRSGADTVAQGASEQASAIEEVSSSMEEMAADIAQNAVNASERKKSIYSHPKMPWKADRL